MRYEGEKKFTLVNVNSIVQIKLTDSRLIFVQMNNLSDLKRTSHSQSARIHSGISLRGELTIVDTSATIISSSGYGMIRDFRKSVS